MPVSSSSSSLSVLRLSREGSLSLDLASASFTPRGSLLLSPLEAGRAPARAGVEGPAAGWELALEPQTFRKVVDAGSGPERARSGAAAALSAPPAFDPHALFALRNGDDEAAVVSRRELLAFLERERPAEIARAIRIADDERRDPACAAMTPQERADDFERRWNADSSAARLNAVLARAPFPASSAPGVSSTVAVWVNRDDLGAIQGRGEAAAWLAAGVRQPEFKESSGKKGRPVGGLDTGRTLEGAEGVAHLAEGFGESRARRLHIDPTTLAHGLSSMAPDRREVALRGLEAILERGGAAHALDKAPPSRDEARRPEGLPLGR